MAGVVGPVAFALGTIYWIYRFTRKVPFPVRRMSEGELVIGLVDAHDVPAHLRLWADEVEPLWTRVKVIVDAAKDHPGRTS
jgi:hypothetical protein